MLFKEPYEVFIGLEIHVQLGTNSKVFCNCNNSFGSRPNENICPICLIDFNDKNYIVPNCGHKVCIKCFVCNLHTKSCTLLNCENLYSQSNNLARSYIYL